MELLPEKVKVQLTPLYSTQDQEDPLVICKFFAPWTYWTHYAIEFDGEDIFYGLVVGHEVELGYFRLSELESVKGPFGLTIERDLYFEPTPLSIIRQQVERR